MTATTLCLVAYLMGMTNAEEVCRQADTVIELSEQYNIDSGIITALVYHESRWSPRAKSRAGACGLTQVIPRWAKKPKLTCSQLRNDPELSLRVGIAILSRLLISKRYANGNMKVALCAYNAGFSNCRSARVKWRGSRYSRRVLKTAKKIHKVASDLESEPEYEVF
jgi:membrane-bound lytic murein transglycosylase F